LILGYGKSECAYYGASIGGGEVSLWVIRDRGDPAAGL